MMRMLSIAMILVLASATFVHAEDETDCIINFSAGMGYGSLDSTGWVPIRMTLPETPCSAPSTVVMNVEFSSAKLTYMDAGLGGGVCNAGKNLTSSETEPGKLTIVIFGINTTPMASGNLVWIGFRALEGVVADELVPVRITEVSASSGDSDSLACSVQEILGGFNDSALPEGVTQGPECEPTPLEGELDEGQSADGQTSEGDISLDGEGGEGDQGDGGDTTDTTGCAGISLAASGPSGAGPGGPAAFVLVPCAFLLIAALRKQRC